METARLGLASAQARYSDLTSSQRVETQDVRDAQARVDTLQQILDSPPEALEAIAATVQREDRELFDAVQGYRDALNGLADETRRTSAAESSLAAASIAAPFPGVVTALPIRVGDSALPGRPVVLIAQGTDPNVRADISADAGRRVAVGQSATVETADQPGARFPATVTDVADSDGGRSITLTPTWADQQPAFGSVSQVSILVSGRMMF